MTISTDVQASSVIEPIIYEVQGGVLGWIIVFDPKKYKIMQVINLEHQLRRVAQRDGLDLDVHFFNPRELGHCLGIVQRLPGTTTAEVYDERVKEVATALHEHLGVVVQHRFAHSSIEVEQLSGGKISVESFTELVRRSDVRQDPMPNTPERQAVPPRATQTRKTAKKATGTYGKARRTRGSSTQRWRARIELTLPPGDRE